jgi:large subunit ribosomal protein L35
MPKLKTHKATSKRVKISGSGKIIRRRGFMNHFMEKKSEGRKRTNRKSQSIDKTREKGVKRSLGI